MAYRAKFSFDMSALSSFRETGMKIEQIIAPLMQDAVDILHRQAVQNLSGVPFVSRTGTHTIHRRSGRAVASLQPQYPYGSPYKARVSANYKTRYAGNPNEYDILAILETGRGEIKPKYTSSAKAGSGKARLTIPDGGAALAGGQKGFRGVTGRYAFVKSIPPMAGKYWMESATKTAQPQIKEMVRDRINTMLGQS